MNVLKFVFFSDVIFVIYNSRGGCCLDLVDSILDLDHPRPGKAKCVVKVCWKHLAEELVRKIFISHL